MNAADNPYAADGTFEMKQLVKGKWVTRRLTLAAYRAELDARAAAAKPIMDAFRAGDIAACDATQKAFRDRFG